MAKATLPTTKAAGDAIHQERAAHLLEEIASVAVSADRSVFWGPQAHDATAEQMQLHVDELRATICRIGWMADLGLGSLGKGPVRGGAENWLLAPTYPKDSEATA